MKYGASYFLDGLSIPEDGASFDPNKAPFMMTLKDKVGPDAAAFNWLATEVCFCNYVSEVFPADLRSTSL
jgi:hypothetical protein